MKRLGIIGLVLAALAVSVAQAQIPPPGPTRPTHDTVYNAINSILAVPTSGPVMQMPASVTTCAVVLNSPSTNTTITPQGSDDGYVWHALSAIGKGSITFPGLYVGQNPYVYFRPYFGYYASPGITGYEACGDNATSVIAPMVNGEDGVLNTYQELIAIGHAGCATFDANGFLLPTGSGGCGATPAPIPCPTASTGITITGTDLPNCSFAATATAGPFTCDAPHSCVTYQATASPSPEVTALATGGFAVPGVAAAGKFIAIGQGSPPRDIYAASDVSGTGNSSFLWVRPAPTTSPAAFTFLVGCGAGGSQAFCANANTLTFLNLEDSAGVQSIYMCGWCGGSTTGMWDSSQSMLSLFWSTGVPATGPASASFMVTDGGGVEARYLNSQNHYLGFNNIPGGLTFLQDVDPANLGGPCPDHAWKEEFGDTTDGCLWYMNTSGVFVAPNGVIGGGGTVSSPLSSSAGTCSISTASSCTATLSVLAANICTSTFTSDPVVDSTHTLVIWDHLAGTMLTTHVETSQATNTTATPTWNTTCL